MKQKDKKGQLGNNTQKRFSSINFFKFYEIVMGLSVRSDNLIK